MMLDLQDEAMSHVRYLASVIGNRLIGSPGNHAAANYIAETFRKHDLSVEFQDFPCPDWVEEFTSLDLGGEALEAYANTFSPSCDIQAPTIAIATFEELSATNISGMIPILYGELVQHELAAKGAIYVSERDWKIIQILEERHPAGLITVNPSMQGRWRLIEDFDLAIPSVTVTAPSGLKLVEHAGDLVHMKIITHRTPSHSANVIGQLKGDRPEQIVICAHYDTKVDTPGTYDNATGVALLLTLVSLLSTTSPRYTLEWIAFSGEEMYGLGDMEYASRIGNRFNQIAAVVNIDSVGPRLAANTIATFSASKSFEEIIAHLKANYPGVTRVDPWPASDHYIFYTNGVPCVAFSSVGMKDIYHTPADTIDWISPDKLTEAVLLVQDILLALNEQEPDWGRP